MEDRLDLEVGATHRCDSGSKLRGALFRRLGRLQDARIAAGQCESDADTGRAPEEQQAGI